MQGTHGSQRHLIQMPPEWLVSYLCFSLHVIFLDFSWWEKNGPEPTPPIPPRVADYLFPVPTTKIKISRKHSDWPSLGHMSIMAREVASCKKMEVPIVGEWERNNSQKKGGDHGKTLPPKHTHTPHSYSFYRCGNLGSEKLSDLLKVTTYI